MEDGFICVHLRHLRMSHLREPVLYLERFQSSHALKIEVLTNDNGVAFEGRRRDPQRE